MSAARRKGTAWETAIVAYLTDAGARNVERRALHGINDRGDITGTPGFTWEAKNHKSLDLAGWVDQMLGACANNGDRLGAVVHKRRGQATRRAYVTMQLDQLVILLNEAGYLNLETETVDA